LREEQEVSPAYAKGHEQWWANVIRKTAVGAGGDSKRVNDAIPQLVPALLNRFSSDEGYELYDDVLPTCEMPFPRYLRFLIMDLWLSQFLR
jgi:hypothetical protein